MLKELLSLQEYFNASTKREERNYSARDRNYSSMGAVTLGATAIGGTRGFGTTKGGTFDYLSTAENTVDCYYQKISDLRYYESHDLTEKVIGLYRDYINQLWREGSDILDIPGEDPQLVKLLNQELEAMDALEIITKDLSDVIYYGSVTYEISKIEDTKKRKKDGSIEDADGDSPSSKEGKEPEGEKDKDNRNIYSSVDAPSDRKYHFEPPRKVKTLPPNGKGYFDQIRDTSYAETNKAKISRLVNSTKPELQGLLSMTKPKEGSVTDPAINELVDSTSPDVQSIVDSTAYERPGVREMINFTKPSNQRGLPGNYDPTSMEAPADASDKIGDIRGRTNHKPSWKLNKVKYPHQTIVEQSKDHGRRYLIRANAQYHLPANKFDIFYYGNDSMRLMEESETKGKGKLGNNFDVFDIIGSGQAMDAKAKKEAERLGIDPKDPKKRPTKYELMNRELSAAVPLFYYHLPKVRELYLKDLVIAILGIKDVIQPDILAMNFEGGTDFDQAQDICNNLEDLLNKNSDYGIFNSAALDYNQLVKLLVDTVRVLPDLDGKIQTLNPVRTTSLQEKIAQIRMEYQELNRNIISALGVPIDLFEGNSSKWEVIKRSERLQSKVTNYINTVKMSLRRLAQAIFYKMTGRELRVTDFKITIFNESELDMAAKANKLNSINELNSTLMQIMGSAERDLAESRLVNKRAYYKLLQAGLKEVYPEVDDLLLIDQALGPENPDGTPAGDDFDDDDDMDE